MLPGVSLEAIASTVAMNIETPNSMEAITRLRSLRRNILSTPTAIPTLVDYLKGGTGSVHVSMEILKLLESFIDTYENGIDIESLAASLLELTIEECLVEKLGSIIAKMARLQYMSVREIPHRKAVKKEEDEEEDEEDDPFLLQVPERDSISDVESCAFAEFLELLSEYVLSMEVTKQEKRKKLSEIRQYYVIPVLGWALQSAGNSPQNALNLICACFNFGEKQTECLLIAESCYTHMASMCSDEGFFTWLFGIASGESGIFAQKVFIVMTFLARTLDAIIEPTKGLVPLLQAFIMNIVGNADPFISDREKSISLRNLIQVIRPVFKECPYDEMIDAVLSFSISLLSNVHDSSVIIVPGVMNLMSQYIRCINASAPDRSRSLFEAIVPLFRSFTEALTTSVESQLEHIYAMMRDEVCGWYEGQLYELLKKLWSWASQSDEESNNVTQMIVTFAEAALSEASDINCCKLAIIQLMITIIFSSYKNHRRKSDMVPMVAALINTAFKIIEATETLPAENQYHELLEGIQLDLLVHFTNTFIPEMKQNNKNELEPLLPHFSWIPAESSGDCEAGGAIFVRFLMNHLFHNLRRNLLVPQTTAEVNKYVKEKRLMSYSKDTDMARTIFEIWQDNMSLDPVFTVLIKLVSVDTDTSMLEEIIAKLASLNPDDPTHVHQILHTSAQLFIAACAGYSNWSNFNRVFIDMHRDHLTKAHYTDILSFMERITIKSGMPNEMPLTFSRYPFMIFRKWIEMLSTCVDALSDIIGPRQDVITTEQCQHWEQLSLIYEILGNIVDSSFCNFGILDIYGDTCVRDLLDRLIDVSMRTPATQLLTVDRFLGNIMNVFAVLINNDRIPELTGAERRVEFLCNITRVSFVCSVTEVTEQACNILSAILVSSDGDTITAFAPHFVLAIDRIFCQNTECAKAVLSFAYKYMVKLGGEGVTSFCENICSGLEDERARADFMEEIGSLFTDEVIKEHQEMTETGVIDVPEETISVMAGDGRGEDIFADRITNMVSRLRVHSIELKDIPCFATYFVSE